MLYHKAMTELQWEPAALGRLTIPQLICLGNSAAPGTKMRPEDWANYFEQKEREKAEWATS